MNILKSVGPGSEKKLLPPRNVMVTVFLLKCRYINFSAFKEDSGSFIKGLGFTKIIFAKSMVYFVNIKPPNVCTAKHPAMFFINFKHAI